LLAVSILFSLAQIPFLMKHAQMGEAERRADEQTQPTTVSEPRD
jgi:hypothetical protein